MTARKRKDNMKRTLYIILMAALVSCNKSEVIDTAGDVISFGNIFVDKTTKEVQDPSHTTASLNQFFVYGNVTGNVDDGNGVNTVNIYKGSEVYKDGAAWNCNTIQYWVPECNYDFIAVSDVDATDPTSGEHNVVVRTTDGLPSSIEYNAASQKDILYASVQDIDTDETAAPKNGTTTDGKVAFTFAHLLSKVQFTFTNNFPENSGVELTVTDIRITNAAKTGTYTPDETPEWAVNSSFTGSGTDYLSFGETNAIAAGGAKGSGSIQCVLIPDTQKYNITFRIKHNKGGTDTDKEITTEEVTLEKGQFYNFTADLNSGNVEGVVPIDFTIITSDAWGGADDEDDEEDEEDEEQVGPVYPVD